MKKNIFSAIMAMLMLVSSLAFVACNGEDQLDTNQYNQPVSMLAFGPSPVARGGELRIVGTGLGQVVSVVIPGCGEVTDINHISDQEIRITVPQNAAPGKISIKTASQSFESKTVISYTEPVGFAENNAIAPNPVKPGQEITIKGEYLNLVQAVIFAENVEVPVTNPTRAEIKVVVPAEAQTGKIAISFCATGDTIPNVIYSPEVLNVVLPTVNEVVNLTGKKPGDLIMHKGSNLDLVARITVAGEDVEWWWCDDDKSTIGYNLPESTPAQATVSMWPASGVECPIAYIGMQLPTELKATPATEIKPGDKIVITGKDLDVVTSALFAGSAAAVEVTEQGTTKLTVEVPADAQSGDITLNCKSGATATVAVVTAKPEAESYNPSPVNAGNVVTINGKNLELVAKIVFTDNLAVTEFVDQTAEALTVKVPATAVSGELAVTMKNGEQVTFKAIDINSPEFCFIPELPNTSETKAGDMICATVVNGDKLTGVQIDGVDCQYILLGEETLYIGTPYNAGQKSTLKLISSNGEIEYAIALIPNSEIVTVLWSGASALGWSGEGQVYIGDDGGQSLIDAGAKAGDILRIKLQPTADDWQVQIWEGHWGGMYDEIKADNYDLAGNDYYYNIVLTDELLTTFTTKQWWGGIVLTQGQSCIVTALELYQKISLETTIWEGELIADDWGNQPYALSDAGAELAAADAKAGQTIRMYITPLDAIWQLEILEGHWGPWYCAFANEADDPKFTIWDLDAHNGAIEFKLTQEMLDAAYVQQWWGGVFVLNGDNVKVTKITIE